MKTRSLLKTIFFIAFLVFTIETSKLKKAKKLQQDQVGEVYYRASLRYLLNVGHQYVEDVMLNKKINLSGPLSYFQLTKNMAKDEINYKVTTNGSNTNIVNAILFLPSFSIKAKFNENKPFIDKNKEYNVTFKRVEIGVEFDLESKNPNAFVRSLTTIKVELQNSDFMMFDSVVGSFLEVTLKYFFSDSRLTDFSVLLFNKFYSKKTFSPTENNNFVLTVSNIKLEVFRKSTTTSQNNGFNLFGSNEVEYHDIIFGYSCSNDSNIPSKKLTSSIIIQNGISDSNYLEVLVGLNVLQSITTGIIKDKIVKAEKEIESSKSLKFENISGFSGNALTLSVKLGNDSFKISFTPSLGFLNKKCKITASNPKLISFSGAKPSDSVISKIANLDYSVPFPFELYASKIKQTFLMDYLKVEIKK